MDASPSSHVRLQVRAGQAAGRVWETTGFILLLVLVCAAVWALGGSIAWMLAASSIAMILVLFALGRMRVSNPLASSTNAPALPAAVSDPAIAEARLEGVSTQQPLHPGQAETIDSIAALVSGLQHAVFRLADDGSFLYLSAAWERLTGYRPEESLGQSLLSHLHPRDREESGPAITMVCSGRREHLLSEVRLLSGSGPISWVELRVSSNAITVTGMQGAVGTFTDITRRKQIEEGLRSSRRHLNTLLANVPGMVYRGRHDRRWTMEFVSDGCLELTGHEPSDIVESGRVAFGDLIHPDDQEFVWALVDTQLAQTKSFQLSYRIIDAAGEIKWVWEQGRGIFSSSGELLALEGFITDVSARRGAEEVARRKLWFDASTGMASRAIFDDRLAYVLDHSRVVGYRCTVLWVDVDNFGEVNARYGRDFGDRVLVQLARRFKVIQGPGATVARVGGDEFAVLVTDLRLGGAAVAVPAGRDLEAAAVRIAERLEFSIADPLRIDGRELRITASIGIAVSSERHVSAEALLQDARRAAAEARASGTGQWRLAEY